MSNTVYKPRIPKVRAKQWLGVLTDDWEAFLDENKEACPSYSEGLCNSLFVEQVTNPNVSIPIWTDYYLVIADDRYISACSECDFLLLYQAVE